MKMTAASLARAFAETAKTLPEVELPALAEAAAHMLIAQGLFKDAHIFPRMVEREWFRRDGAVQVKITTAGLPTKALATAGGAGTLEKDIARVVEQALKRSCSVEEDVDSSLLGGVLLQIGDERYDASLRGALHDLSAQLAASISLPS